MTSDFLDAWLATGREEGGYVNNPNDSGGETNHGITEQVARAHGWKGLMQDLPKDLARQIAKQQYWDIIRLDDVAQLSKRIAKEMFDTGFNAGQAVVVTFLQRCLNVANRIEADYSDIKADGLMGKITIASLKAFLAKRGKDGEMVMLRALNCLQGNHYTELAEARKKDETFWFGWMFNRVEI